MNLSEAKAKFPIGSMVEVVNCRGEYASYSEWGRKNLLPDDYAAWEYNKELLHDGDIGEVAVVAPHCDPFMSDIILVGIRVGGKPYIIDSKDIRPCENGEHYLAKVSGNKLTVSAFGETAEFDLRVIIEELYSQCLKKKNTIKVGDKVRIVDSDQCYPTYKDWLKENADFDQALMFDWGSTPPYGYLAIVHAIARHSSVDDSLLYLVGMERDGDERMYLMAEDGIEKI